MSNPDEKSFHDAALAHDIREINTQIKGYIERVTESLKRHRNILDKEEHDALTVFFASEMITKRLDIYDFYINSKAINVREKKFGVHRVMMKLLKILHRKAEHENVSVIIHESLLEIQSSAGFEVALFVILENCIKYSPNKSTVHVYILEEDRNIIIQFTNYGPYLAEDELPQIYDFGFRGKMAMKKGKTGSGIGLNFAKRMCEIHNFDISFRQNKSDSISKQGLDYWATEITIRIPKG